MNFLTLPLIKQIVDFILYVVQKILDERAKRKESSKNAETLALIVKEKNATPKT